MSAVKIIGNELSENSSFQLFCCPVFVILCFLRLRGHSLSGSQKSSSFHRARAAALALLLSACGQPGVSMSESKTMHDSSEE